MADITKIQIESGIYNIKDETARNMIINPSSNRKYVLISDSYGEGYTPNGYIDSWFDYFKTLNGLTSANCTTNCLGGAGFGGTLTTKDFYDLVNELTSDDDVTDVVICGGYNDTNFTFGQIMTGIQNVNTLVKTKFPNARLSIGMIGAGGLSNKKEAIFDTLNAYVRGCCVYNINYLNNVEYILKDRQFLTADCIHPNADGQLLLGYWINSALKNGSANIVLGRSDLIYTLSSPWNQIRGRSLSCSMTNNIVHLVKGSKTTLNTPTPISCLCDGEHSVEIGRYDNAVINGLSNGYTCVNTSFILYDGTNFKHAQGCIKIVDNTLFAYPILVENNAYTTIGIVELQILPYSASFNSILC